MNTATPAPVVTPTAVPGPSAEGVFSFPKAQIRAAALDIVFGRTSHHPHQIGALITAVGAHLVPPAQQVPPGHPRLSIPCKLLIREVFWDLIVDKILTPGLNAENHDLPFFRLHSEAAQNAKK